jgi:hypothetical protein
MEGAMNCLRKKREKEAEAADLTTLKEKEEIKELEILLVGRSGLDDCDC